MKTIFFTQAVAASAMMMVFASCSTSRSYPEPRRYPPHDEKVIVVRERPHGPRRPYYNQPALIVECRPGMRYERSKNGRYYYKDSHGRYYWRSGNRLYLDKRHFDSYQYEEPVYRDWRDNGPWR